MKKVFCLVVAFLMAVQMSAFANTVEKAAEKTPAKSVSETATQKGKVLGSSHHEKPRVTTSKEKLSTSGHRNDREGTEDADTPLPDEVRIDKLNKAAGERLDDTPRNPVRAEGVAR